MRRLICRSCNLPTHDHYMVHDEVWTEATAGFSVTIGLFSVSSVWTSLEHATKQDALAPPGHHRLLDVSKT